MAIRCHLARPKALSVDVLQRLSSVVGNGISEGCRGEEGRSAGIWDRGVPPKRKLKPRSERLGRLGAAIETMRRRAGLSQEELAARSGLHTTHIGGLERGVRNPTYETLGQIADALGISPGELVAGAEPPRQKTTRG